jgi:TolA-binding protein
VRVNTAGERSLLDIGDARIESDLGTDFTVTRPDGGVLVTLQRGMVELTVDKRGKRAPLVVAAGDTRVIVVGTKFSVDYGDGSDGVDVRVTEGVVKVEHAQNEVRVAAGQAWTTKRGVIALAELPFAMPADRVAMAQQPKLPTPEDGPTIKDPTKKPAEAIDINTDTPDILKKRESSVPDSKIPTTGVHNGSNAKKPTGPELGVRPQPSTGGSGSMDLRKQVLSEEVLPPLDVGEATAEQSISKLREKAFNVPKGVVGEQASLAHYSIAYLQAIKMGRTDDALTTLEQYVRRYNNGGKEYKAALWLRVRILCTKGEINDRCRQAAFTYMHQAAGTHAAKVAEALTLSPR